MMAALTYNLNKYIRFTGKKNTKVAAIIEIASEFIQKLLSTLFFALSNPTPQYTAKLTEKISDHFFKTIRA